MPQIKARETKRSLALAVTTRAHRDAAACTRFCSASDQYSEIKTKSQQWHLFSAKRCYTLPL